MESRVNKYDSIGRALLDFIRLIRWKNAVLRADSEFLIILERTRSW